MCELKKQCDEGVHCGYRFGYECGLRVAMHVLVSYPPSLGITENAGSALPWLMMAVDDDVMPVALVHA